MRILSFLLMALIMLSSSNLEAKKSIKKKVKKVAKKIARGKKKATNKFIKLPKKSTYKSPVQLVVKAIVKTNKKAVAFVTPKNIKTAHKNVLVEEGKTYFNKFKVNKITQNKVIITVLKVKGRQFSFAIPKAKKEKKIGKKRIFINCADVKYAELYKAISNVLNNNVIITKLGNKTITLDNKVYSYDDAFKATVTGTKFRYHYIKKDNVNIISTKPVISDLLKQRMLLKKIGQMKDKNPLSLAVKFQPIDKLFNVIAKRKGYKVRFGNGVKSIVKTPITARYFKSDFRKLLGYVCAMNKLSIHYNNKDKMITVSKMKPVKKIKKALKKMPKKNLKKTLKKINKKLKRKSK